MQANFGFPHIKIALIFCLKKTTTKRKLENWKQKVQIEASKESTNPGSNAMEIFCWWGPVTKVTKHCTDKVTSLFKKQKNQQNSNVEEKQEKASKLNNTKKN